MAEHLERYQIKHEIREIKQELELWKELLVDLQSSFTVVWTQIDALRNYVINQEQEKCQK